MISYKTGHNVGGLEPWPFDNPESDYVITQGAPAASGRMDGGGAGHTWRSGIWHCTAGTFMCNELGDEMQTILTGRVRVIQADGTAHEFGPGDTFFTKRGERVTWDVIEDVTKVFFSVKEDGF